MRNKKTPIRVMIAKAGLDGHDRGAKVIVRSLRDAGMEVIYTGLHNTPAEIAESAVQEDVACLGVSVLSGAHMTIFPDIIKQLKKRKAKDIIVFGGGIIPEDDIKKLKKIGVKEIFGPGAATTEIIAWINDNCRLSD